MRVKKTGELYWIDFSIRKHDEESPQAPPPVARVLSQTAQLPKPLRRNLYSCNVRWTGRAANPFSCVETWGCMFRQGYKAPMFTWFKAIIN